MPHPKTDWLKLLKKLGADPSILHRPLTPKPTVKANLLVGSIAVEIGYREASARKEAGFYFIKSGFSYTDKSGFETAEECLIAALAVMRRDLTNLRDKYDRELKLLPPGTPAQPPFNPTTHLRRMQPDVAAAREAVEDARRSTTAAGDAHFNTRWAIQKLCSAIEHILPAKE